MTAAALLAALQLSDSALPIGRFVHSGGLEAWLAAHPDAGHDALGQLVELAVCEGVAPLDGAVLAHAYRARDPEELAELDRRLSARKLPPRARLASQACGRQLAALAGALTADALALSFAERVRERAVDGNLAVVEGTVARALGLAEGDAVLVELRGSAAALLSAAVRLGRLSPLTAQGVLLGLAPALAAAAEEARGLALADLASTAPALEIGLLAHSRAPTRFFSS